MSERHPSDNNSDSKPVSDEVPVIKNLLERVVMGAQSAKSKMSEIAFELAGWTKLDNGPGYLKPNESDHRFVMAFVEKVLEKPEEERRGWEEIWLPQAVYGQCIKDEEGNAILDKDGNVQPRVTVQQANRLAETFLFQSRQRDQK